MKLKEKEVSISYPTAQEYQQSPSCKWTRGKFNLSLLPPKEWPNHQANVFNGGVKQEEEGGSGEGIVLSVLPKYPAPVATN